MKKYLIIASIIITVILLFLILYSQKKNNIFNPSASWTLNNPITYYAPFIGTKNILTRFNISEGMYVLDIGCGPGRFTIPIAKLVGQKGKVLAVDIQPDMVNKMQEYAFKENINNIEARVINVGAKENKLDSNYFDFAFMVTVLGEVPIENRIQALKEIYQSLKSNGILSITEIQTDSDYLSVSIVREITKKAGFHEVNYFSNWKSYTITLKKI